MGKPFITFEITLKALTLVLRVSPEGASMIRKILAGLLGVISVSAVGILPLACQSGGVGDPCLSFFG